MAKALGVRYVLEGSVRKSENRVRITAQLIDAETGKHVWANRYDRTLEDIFAIQDEITEEIVVSLDVALLEGLVQRGWRKFLKTPEARALFNRNKARLAIAVQGGGYLAGWMPLAPRSYKLEPTR